MDLILWRHAEAFEAQGEEADMNLQVKRLHRPCLPLIDLRRRLSGPEKGGQSWSALGQLRSLTIIYI